jgi:hypothetical protein
MRRSIRGAAWKLPKYLKPPGISAIAYQEFVYDCRSLRRVNGVQYAVNKCFRS